MRRSRWFIFLLGATACEAAVELEPRSESPDHVTTTTTSTTGTSPAAPEPPLPPLPPIPEPAGGDGVLDRERGETCDDGNTTNLDACDATCQFEQVVRFNELRLRFATDRLCRANAIGTAIGSA